MLTKINLHRIDHGGIFRIHHFVNMSVFNFTHTNMTISASWRLTNSVINGIRESICDQANS